MLQDDILCLVFGHPLAHYFLFEPKTPQNTTSYTTFPSGYPSATLLSQTPVPEVRRISPRERSVFSVRYRCLCEIIASGGREGKHTYFCFILFVMLVIAYDSCTTSLTISLSIPPDVPSIYFNYFSRSLFLNLFSSSNLFL